MFSNINLLLWSPPEREEYPRFHRESPEFFGGPDSSGQWEKTQRKATKIYQIRKLTLSTTKPGRFLSG